MAGKKYDTKISVAGTKALRMCRIRLTTEIERKIVDQVSVFNYIADMISEIKHDIKLKIQKCNKINETMKKQILYFVDRAFRYICVIKTNLMHYLSSVYFVNQPLHVLAYL
jgi:hypothetical protein